MTEQPKTVVCTSCSAKFLVPDELIRGKLVKFRCRKCGEAIDVDGRRSARPPAPPPPPIPEITAVDTPATFSQRTLPPPRPPVALSKSSPSLHPWPEPPPSRARSTTAPTAISDSMPPPEESLPRLEMVRDPSNRGPKIAAIVALLIAAGLSGFGLAMRGSPAAPAGATAGERPESETAALPIDPATGRKSAGRETKLDETNPNRANRSATRVTDLPPAVEGVEPATAIGGSVAARPSEVAPEKQEVPREAVNAATPLGAGHAAAAPNATAPTAAAPNAAAALNPAENPSPAAVGVDPGANPSPSPAPTYLVPGAAPNVPAIPNAAAPQPGASPPPAVATPTPGGRGKGDFNTQAAREALEDAAGRAGKCRNIDTPTGTARVAVTFAPNGHVTNAVIESGPFVGTAAGTCVASKFRAAKVPAFSGDSVVVRKSVPF